MWLLCLQQLWQQCIAAIQEGAAQAVHAEPCIVNHTIITFSCDLNLESHE